MKIALPADDVVSEWILVSHERIRAFADVTEDRQWIHIDAPEPIAHGFLILSLLARLAPKFEGTTMTLNYGLNRVRFLAPVPAGSRIRARFAVADVEEREGTKVTWSVTVECDATTKPCCIAEWVLLYR